MPRRKKVTSTKSAKAMHEMIDTKTEGLLPKRPEASSSLRSRLYQHRWAYLFILVLAVVGIYLGSQGYLVSATVDGQPIFGWELAQTMLARYGTQTLDSIVSERLVAKAAAKAGISITQKDVDAKITDLVKSLGPGVKLDDLLAYQGVTKNDFENQVKLQLTVEKLLGKDVKITDSDIADYIAKNKDTLTATDDAGLQEEARQTLFSQAISQKIQPWFTDLKAKASIVRLLK